MKQIPCEDESTIDDLPKSFLLYWLRPARQIIMHSSQLIQFNQPIRQLINQFITFTHRNLAKTLLAKRPKRHDDNAVRPFSSL